MDTYSISLLYQEGEKKLLSEGVLKMIKAHHKNFISLRHLLNVHRQRKQYR